MYRKQMIKRFTLWVFGILFLLFLPLSLFLVFDLCFAAEHQCLSLDKTNAAIKQEQEQEPIVYKSKGLKRSVSVNLPKSKVSVVLDPVEELFEILFPQPETKK